MADHAHNLRATRGGRTGRPFGVITRGTTNQNRLRKCDRWLLAHPQVSALLRGADAPLCLDVGYGASHTTTVEWARWLRRANPGVDVRGLEIDPERVLPPHEGVRFELGGFELAGYRPHLVRAFNVLRQYDVDQVPVAWAEVTGRLAPGGFFVEGTCDEVGRLCTWILLDATGPRTLTLSWDPHHVAAPSELAQRLPKALIHRNVPGEPIHALLQAADAAWDAAAGWAPHGPRVRWRQAHAQLIAQGWPLRPHRRRLSDNCLSIAWEHVAPH